MPDPSVVTLCQPYAFSITWLLVLMMGIHTSMRCEGRFTEKFGTVCCLVVVLAWMGRHAPQVLPIRA